VASEEEARPRVEGVSGCEEAIEVAGCEEAIEVAGCEEAIGVGEVAEAVTGEETRVVSHLGRRKQVK
jgi:hypothetical protein